MKKSLLALAVAAALPAVAFAQTNSVLNGSIDTSLEYFDSDVEGQDSDVRVTNGVWSGSRFAISGTEELGGGLKGIFNIEHRLSPDTGTVTSGATFWAGQAWVGLQGGFGAIRLGRQYTPMFRALAPGDTTGYSWYNNPVGLAGTAIRFNNDVSYQSPSLGGFTVHAAYVAGEGDPAATGLPGAADPLNTDVGDALGLAAVGSFGPINVGLGYHRIDAGDFIAGADDTDELGASLGAKFGNFGVGVGYAQREVADTKRKAMFLSGSAGFGAGTLYLTLKRDDQGLEDADNDGIGLTYSHGLSKRTFVYASLGYNKIEAANGNETKPKAVALGIRHFF
jgi:predicted porin